MRFNDLMSAAPLYKLKPGNNTMRVNSGTIFLITDSDQLPPMPLNVLFFLC